MSDTMLHSILQMLPELWTNDAIDIAQRHGRYLEASKRIIELERERDEARRDLVAAEELHRRRFATLKAEYDAACARFTELERERDEARRLASVWEKLALREASINGAKICAKEEA